MTLVQMAWAKDFLEIPVPDRTIVQNLEPAFPPPLPETDLERIILAGLQLIESKIATAVNPVIILEDSSRATDTAPVVSILIREMIARRGGKRSGIRVMVAAGAHYHLSSAEIGQKTGTLDIPVMVHDSTDANQLCRVGRSKDGIELWLNRAVVESDLRMTISTVNIHPMAGYSGGGKILLPGVAGLETINALHSLPQSKPGCYHNQMRELINEVLLHLPVAYSWQLLSRPDGGIFGLAHGRVTDAHLEAIKGLSSVVSIGQSREIADLLLAGCRPFNQNLLGTFKSLAQLELLVRPGGTVVLFNEMPRGTGEHYWRKQPEVVERQKARFAQVYGNVEVWIYAPHADDRDFEWLFPEKFRLIKDYQDLLHQVDWAGSTAVTILPYAPVTLIS